MQTVVGHNHMPYAITIELFVVCYVSEINSHMQNGGGAGLQATFLSLYIQKEI